MNNLTAHTLTQAIELIRTGEVSSRELTEGYLERIEQLDPMVNSFLHVAQDTALLQAEEADKKLIALRKSSNARIPPLAGVPIAVKDVLAVKGMPCTCGSKILEKFVPPYNATPVKRLLDAGAVILGKTNTDEFAMGSSTENSAYGVTHNPWDLHRVPGGSSGGSAAAVAARFAPIALGTDTGGSVRQPASYCGVVGLKPTYGRVSRYGLVAYGSSLDCVGTIGREIADIALIFSIMAGYDPLDSTSMDTPLPHFHANIEKDLEGMRIGVPEEYFIGGIQPDVEGAVRGAIQLMESLGAQIRTVSLPHTEYAVPVYYLLAPAEASANLARYDGIRYGPRSPADALWDVFSHTRGENFGPEVKRRIMLGTYALSAGYYDAFYGQAQKVRTLIKRDFDIAFNSVDVIATPVAPTTAFRIGEHDDDPLAMYLEDVFTLPANLAGIPGISFPVGFDEQGLPIGMQLMGPPFREQLLFQAAHVYQIVTDWHKRETAL